MKALVGAFNQPGEGPSRGLFRYCAIFANLRSTFVWSPSVQTALHRLLTGPCYGNVNKETVKTDPVSAAAAALVTSSLIRRDDSATAEHSTTTLATTHTHHLSNTPPWPPSFTSKVDLNKGTVARLEVTLLGINFLRSLAINKQLSNNSPACVCFRSCAFEYPERGQGKITFFWKICNAFFFKCQMCL